MTASLAAALKGFRVLRADFDTVNPELDKWLSANPVSGGLPGAARELPQERKTAFGVFSSLGLPAFLENKAALIKHSDKTGADFFGGLYTQITSSALINADFTGLFDVLGGMYDYIIIDMGRLGCSFAKDSLIMSLQSIASKNIVITEHSFIDARNTRLKLDALNAPYENLLWVLNFSATNISEQAKTAIDELLEGVQTVQILKIPTMCNTNESFISSRFLSPKISEIKSLITDETEVR
jgi:hypothetical protein